MNILFPLLVQVNIDRRRYEGTQTPAKLRSENRQARALSRVQVRSIGGRAMEMRGIIQLVWNNCRGGDAVMVHMMASSIGNEIVVR